MKERAFALGVVGGVLAIVVTLGWVLFYGRLDPSPPSLQDEPNPAIRGQILYVDGDDCIILAEASGAMRQELECRPNIGAVTWLDDGDVLFSVYGPAPAQWWRMDMNTGETRRIEIDVDPFQVIGPPDLESPNGETYTQDDNGDAIVVDASGELRTVFEYDGPQGYSPEFRSWSPDGDFLLLYYGRDNELWIIGANGETAGTLDDDASWSTTSWRIDGVGTRPELMLPADDLR